MLYNKLLQTVNYCVHRWVGASGIMFLINKLRLMPAAPADHSRDAAGSLGFIHPVTNQHLSLPPNARDATSGVGVFKGLPA